MKIKLYHLTNKSFVDNIVKEGIKKSKTSCKDETKERENAVFAYDLETLKEIAKYGKLDDKVIEFEVDSKEVYVGDLRLECTKKYKNTWMRFDEYKKLKDLRIKKHIEPEMVIPKDISKEKIISIKDRKLFI